MRQTMSLGLIGSAALLSSIAFAQDAAIPDPADPPTVVRTGTTDDNRITIPIRIAGKGPYDFIIDTGAQRTVISRELAASLALPADGRLRIVSATGVSETDSVTMSDVSFGTTRIARVQAPIFADEHIGGHGLLGLDGLRAKRLVLDFRSGRMNIEPSQRRVTNDPDAIVVEARTRLGQLILVDAKADGQKVNVILDTGSESSIGNKALLAKLSKKRPDAFRRTTGVTSVTGEELVGQWGVIDRMRLGGVGINGLAVVFADVGPFRELGLEDKPALLLGAAVLRGFDRVAIDFGRRRVDFLLPASEASTKARMAALGAPVTPRNPRDADPVHPQPPETRTPDT